MAALAGSLGAAPTTDAERRPLREARSANQQWALRIDAGRPDRSPCRARLLHDGGERRTLWDRELVNDVAPVQARIRDDGKYLITLDEFRRGGARHALVVYGARGELLRHWVLTDLLVAEDWKHVRTRGRTLDWLAGAECEFAATDEFVIRLKWGRTLRLDLAHLKLLGAPAGEDAAQSPPAEVLAALAADGADPDIEAVAGTQPSADADAIQAVAQVMTEGTGASLEIVRMIEEAIAAAQLTEPLADADGVSSRPVADGPRTSEPASADVVHIDADRMAAQAQAAKMMEGVPVHANYVGNEAVAATGISVPLPDPAHPVDYLAWLRQQTDSGDTSARVELQGVMDTVVDYRGEDGLLDRALEGDPVALSSPEIQSWRTANQPAIQHLRDFGLYDYRGPELNSDDGSLIGILLPALGSVRKAAKAAVVEANALVHEGRTDEAIDLYLDVARAATQTSRGPTMIENLVGVAVQRLALKGLQTTMAGAAGAGLDYADLAGKLEFGAEPVRPLPETLQMERAMLFDTLQRGFEYDAEAQSYRPRMEELTRLFQMGSDKPPEPLTLLGLATLDYPSTLAGANQYYDELTAAMARPYAEARPQFKSIAERISAPGGNVFIQTMMPSLDRATFLQSRGESERRGAILAANILAHRQQHGQLPETLDSFADRSFSLDPLSGQRFRYVREGDSFRLYALGANGTDDGGTHDKTAETNDLVIWPRPTESRPVPPPS